MAGQIGAGSDPGTTRRRFHAAERPCRIWPCVPQFAYKGHDCEAPLRAVLSSTTVTLTRRARKTSHSCPTAAAAAASFFSPLSTTVSLCIPPLLLPFLFRMRRFLRERRGGQEEARASAAAKVPEVKLGMGNIHHRYRPPARPVDNLRWQRPREREASFSQVI